MNYEDEAFDELEKKLQKQVAHGVTDGSLWRKRQEPEALKRITRDDTEHDRHYYLADEVDALLAQPEQEPVSKLQEPTAERAWFTIAELNAWADKKLSENPHWVMPKDEPERDEPPPQQEPVAWFSTLPDGKLSIKIVGKPTEGYWEPLYTTPPQRTWVGLTDEDKNQITERFGLADVAWLDLMQAIEAKLKEKNG